MILRQILLSFLILLCCWQQHVFAVTELTVRQAVKNLEFQDMKSYAVNFTLEDLKNDEKSFSEYRGKWILLSFWSTWCVACKAEAALLEKIQQSMKGKMEVLVISSGEDAGIIKSYLDENKLSLSVFLDSKKEIARKYRVTGYPVYYLISPEWYVVGIHRGSLDMKNIFTGFKELLSLNVKSSEENANEKKSDRLYLSEDFKPLQVVFIVPSGGNFPNRWISLKILIRWQGDEKKYFVEPPKLRVPESITLGATSISTSFVDKETIMKYRIKVMAKEGGDYFLGPLEINYGLRENGKTTVDQTMRLAGDTLRIKQSRANWFWPLMISLIFIFGLLIYLGYKWLPNTFKKQTNLPPKE